MKSLKPDILKPYIAVAAAATFLMSGAAFAQNDDTLVQGERIGDRPVALVKYRDINFATPKASDMLHARVRRAASRICEQSGVVDLATAARGWRCRDEAVARAEPQVAEVITRFQNRDVAALRSSTSIRVQ